MGVELMDSSVIWYAVLAVVVVALVFVLFNFNKVKKLKEKEKSSENFIISGLFFSKRFITNRIVKLQLL